MNYILLALMFLIALFGGLAVFSAIQIVAEHRRQRRADRFMRRLMGA